jgi:ribonuclease Z
MLDVCLLGTGGMMPLPRRKLTACMTRFQGHHLLIDCGEGTQVGIKEKGWSVKPLDAICFTHFHADHISGLPGLLLTLGNAERTEPLLIIGPLCVEKVVNSLRVIAPDLPFEIEFYELRQKEHRIQMEGYYIEAFQVKHNITCYGYNMVIREQGSSIHRRQRPMRFR